MLRISRLRAVLPLVLLTLTTAAIAGGPRWFATDYDTPPGSRMKCHSGKQWPLAARPCGPCEPFVHQYHTQHYWPDPYRWEDRCNVRAALAGQADRGWIQATTLYDQHFDDETQELNLAGRKRLEWIVLHAPAHRRQPFVQTSVEPGASQIRLASVQNLAGELAGPNCPVAILRVAQPIGQNGQEAEEIRRRYLSSTPDPRLPFTSLSGSSQEATDAPAP